MKEGEIADLPIEPVIETKCFVCGGDGEIEHQTSIVTHDMASDAGQPELEGQPIFEKIQCGNCNGRGMIVSDELLRDAVKVSRVSGDFWLQLSNRESYVMPEPVIDQILKWRDEHYGKEVK